MAEFEIVAHSPRYRYSKYGSIIGRGAYKTVHYGYDSELGIMVAWNEISLLKLSPAQKEKIRDEVKILSELKQYQKHPNILNIHSSWFNRESNTIVFITDLFHSGSLKSFIGRVKRFKIRSVKKWCQNILAGLKFLHERKVIHRDLKCDNLFIRGTSGNIVIGDFGISRVVADKGNASTVLGTPEFMAPEIYDEKYNEKSDIYSFGMCLLEMVTNQTPYSECGNVPQIWRKVTSKTKPDSLISVEIGIIRDLIDRCINYDPDERPGIEEIMAHPFFTDDGLDDIMINFGDTTVATGEKVAVQKTIEDEIEEALKHDTHLEESVVDDTHSGGSNGSAVGSDVEPLGE